MKFTIVKMMTYISSTIFCMKTPMSMGVLLILQTLMCTTLISLMSNNSWIPMIIFLMLIGGLLILFMYMSSIASNEKFSSNLIFVIIMFMLMILPFENLMMEETANDKMMTTLMNESISLMKIYNKKTMSITLMLFMYLLLCMIAVSKMLKIYKGPLRSK